MPEVYVLGNSSRKRRMVSCVFMFCAFVNIFTVSVLICKYVEFEHFLKYYFWSPFSTSFVHILTILREIAGKIINKYCFLSQYQPYK